MSAKVHKCQVYIYFKLISANCYDSISKSIEQFLLNVDTKSRFAPNVDSSTIDRQNYLRLISDVTKLNQENTNDVITYYAATFCLHDCFFIKFRYFGGFSDQSETGNIFWIFSIVVVLMSFWHLLSFACCGKMYWYYVLQAFPVQNCLQWDL